MDFIAFNPATYLAYSTHISKQFFWQIYHTFKVFSVQSSFHPSFSYFMAENKSMLTPYAWEKEQRQTYSRSRCYFYEGQKKQQHMCA